MAEIKELTGLTATHVSYVRKGANRKEFFLMKSGEAEPVFQKDFDIIVNKADEKKLVYGVVYEPDAVDTQGEFAKAETIEKAAHQFLSDCRNVDLQHNFQPGFGTVVESYIAPGDFKIGAQEVKKGAWVLVTKANDEVWEDIKKGEITGYSMAGKATKTTVTGTDLKKEALGGSDDEVKGFYNVLKSFFTGKVEKAQAADVKTFAQRMAVNDVTDKMWKVTDTLHATMTGILSNADIKDKSAELNKAIDEFAAYMKKRVADVDSASVKKSDIDFFSGYDPKIKNNEGEVEMKKEELQEVIKATIDAAIAPISEKLAALEKQDTGAEEEATPEDDTAKVIKAAVDEALKPLADRISTIEKAKGASRQEQEQPGQENVKKSVFAGLLI